MRRIQSNDILSKPSINQPSFKPYIELISRALAQIDAGYFKLTTTYEPSGIVRERVFCYELYHQIRSLMSKDDPLSLNGEIDKRGHIDFEQEDRRNPDFVFHIPGIHQGNTIAIEVKGRLNRRNEILEDLETLMIFIEKYSYQVGVFILYNHTIEQLIGVVGDTIDRFTNRSGFRSIYVLAIRSPNEIVQVQLLSDHVK